MAGTVAAKGLVALDIIVTGPATDLHSGRHGGAVQNPVHALARILASHGYDVALTARRADRLDKLAEELSLRFGVEALTVTAMGGLIGVALGLGAAQFLNGRNIAGLGNDIQTVVSWTSVAVAFAVSAAIGVFFGIYPAQRAARLNPIEALRYE